ncbi:MAG: hypothetical protein RMH97_06940 [Verrucomicrobiales bacterium]|nr:hypothetical protein [Verrucomicrobiales bacterium]
MIIELDSPFEIIRVTAEYSNAVLVAVLPYITDVAERLELPIQKPVTPECVTRCTILPSRKIGDLCVGIGIKGGWGFMFRWGYVDTIESPDSYFVLQDPAEIPRFFGTVRMTSAEAIQMARDALTKLGIPLEAVFAEQEPRVTEPLRIGTNIVPRYLIEWRDPRSDGQFAPVSIEINAEAKRLERLRVFSKALERPPPKISAVPPPDLNFPKWPSVNPEYAQRLLPLVLQAAAEYSAKLALPVPRPLSTNHVARFAVTDNGGWPHCELELTNGWTFVYRGSTLNGFYAPDTLFSLYSERRPILIRDFVGKWNMTESEAIALVSQAVAKLGYPSNLVRMDFSPAVMKSWVTNIPRYMFHWWAVDETGNDLICKLEAEVDADARQLKSLYFDHKSFWNKPPPIDVPITLPAATNRQKPSFPSS